MRPSPRLQSILTQEFPQGFHIFELNYGEDETQLVKALPATVQVKNALPTHPHASFHRLQHTFLRVPLQDHAYAMNYLLDLVFSDERRFQVVFNVNLDDYYDTRRFQKQVRPLSLFLFFDTVPPVGRLPARGPGEFSDVAHP